MPRRRTEADPKTFFTRRAFMLAGLQAAVGTIVVGRLGYLGLLRAPHYRTLADDNRIKLQVLLPRRALILDRGGVVLAGNEPNYRLVVVPDQTPDLPETLRQIDQLIGIDLKTPEEILAEIKQRPRFAPALVREYLSWEEVCRVQVNLPDLPGVEIIQGHRRQYTMPFETAHLIGYVRAPSPSDEVDEEFARLPDYRIGKTGLENTFDDDLQGVAGFKEIEINARRQIVRELNTQENKPSAPLELSIHSGLQTYCYQRLADVKSGAAVVMDNQTGEVYALSSAPSYDTNDFIRGLSKAQWTDLSTHPYQPLIDKTAHAVYEPASLYKMIVALAGLEAGVITPHTQCFCGGHYTLGTHRYHCWHRDGHGSMNLEQALAASCDVFFYETAQSIGVDRMTAMAARFGLGAPTGIELPHEKSGLIGGRDWKKTQRNMKWTPADTVMAAIGQGSLLTTPLQLAQMTARLMTGRAIRPTLVRRQSSPIFETLALKPEHLQLIKRGLDGCVNSPIGTAYFARPPEGGLMIGGKTGTAQVRRISKQERQNRVLKNTELEWKQRDHALFVGYAPLDSPRFSVAVVIEHGGGGGTVSAPIGRDILTKACELLQT